ncbi:MAG: SRPBCC family protein [Acidobacteria bacterium]|nr:SRPBCC family protein [Acidobacteriota bacterium]
METESITIKAVVSADIDKVWTFWTEPEYIVNWNFASDEWHCPNAQNDLRVGGAYSARMEAKDGSFGFDFSAIYDEVIVNEKIIYTMEDGRKVVTEFHDNSGSTTITTIFDAESENSAEMQRQGWQAILDNFKKYTETA